MVPTHWLLNQISKSLLSWFASRYLVFLGYQNKQSIFISKINFICCESMKKALEFYLLLSMLCLYVYLISYVLWKAETAFWKKHWTTALFGKILCSICLEKDLELTWDYFVKFSQPSQESFRWSFFTCYRICCES